MASRVSGNFGTGIARSAVLPDRTGQVLAYGAQQRAAKQKKEEKDDEAWKDYLDDVSVKGVHRLDQELANENAAKTIDRLAALRQANPNNWKNMAPSVIMDFQTKQNEYLSRNKYLTTLEKEFQEANKGGRTTPAQQQAYEAMSSGGWKDFQRIQSDEIGSFKFNPENNGISMNFVPDFDKAAFDKRILENDYQTDLSFSSQAIPGAPGGAKAVVSEYNTPEAKLAEFNLRALVGEPAYAKRAEAEFMAAGRLPKGYKDLPETDEANPMNPNTKFGVLYQENLKDIKRWAGTRKEVSIQKPPRPRQAKDDTVKDEGLDDMLKGNKLTLNEPILTAQTDAAGKKMTKQYESKYSLPVATSAYTIVTADKTTLDLAKGKFFEEQAQFNFKPGSIKLVRPKVGAPYEPMVFGQAIDSSIPLDEKGEPLFNYSTLKPAGEKTAYKDIMVPLEKVKNLMTSKYKTPIKWAYEAAERLNAEEPKKQSPKSAATNNKAEDLRKKYGY